MKKLFCIALGSCLFMISAAQTKVTTVEYQKISRPALVNEVPFSSKTIESAIDDTLSKLGYKSSSSKGFTVYKAVKLAELGNDAYDLYFMVDKKSRRDKENSTVTLMLSKDFDAFLSESSDKKAFNGARDYLDSLRNIVAAYDLEQQILTQEDEVKNADNKNTSLQDESKELEKKKRKLDDQIEENARNQKNQVKEIEKQRQILETLKARRKH